ncbi:Short-chain dehydrogenase/reductase SDR [Candidatus Promineifilum breve]|uniref:Short-chain dehydrogenase/reductase SDR n=1 Tax=Candidatus Promineifilum breve TaxID=1806508 RepID=A0A160T2E8_9CHLR|nr:SDR family oxidoreductase [Candidatus Promineifilum breve]CUS02620.2 Short-chain dehydrogenase/reductase SDR [Candidatus Promineifilum breve]
MTELLKGKVAVVTGASRGIGQAAAVTLAQAGAAVVVTSRTEPELAELAARIERMGGQALAVPADLTQEADVERMKAAALERFGHVDILVNNAGVGKYGPLASLSAADYDWMMNTNMRASFLCTAAFLPGMLERREGWVVFIASVAGLKGLPHETVYCATKFAQVGFAQALDYETREQGVKVSVIAPGGVHTHFAIGTGRTEDDPRFAGMMEAQDVAEAVLFAVTQPEKVRAFLIGLRPMGEPL